MRERWLVLALGSWLVGTFACEGEFASVQMAGGAVGGDAGAAGDASMTGAGGSDGTTDPDSSMAGTNGDGTGAVAGADSDADDAGGSGGEGGSDAVEPVTCQSMASCATGENCVANRCVPALVSCAAQKNSYPTSKDGVYWIGTVGAWQRAYCDMQLSAELCTEVAGEHRGRTRGKAAIDYTMTSVLLLNQEVCKLWALRGTDDGHPFVKLVAVEGVAEGQTCVGLGFVADGALGECKYGTQYTDCGFTATPLYWYGNDCEGCVKNDGSYDRWTLQGPAISALTLSSVSGTSFTTCKVKG